jgi:hypothetical protein
MEGLKYEPRIENTADMNIQMEILTIIMGGIIKRLQAVGCELHVTDGQQTINITRNSTELVINNILKEIN